MGPPSWISDSIFVLIFSAADTTLASLWFCFVRRRVGRSKMVLRSVGEHFDEVVVESVVELALQMPGKLGMVEIARVNGEDVGVNRDGGIFQVDQNFDGAIIFAR